jgi:hypothetical protein
MPPNLLGRELLELDAAGNHVGPCTLCGASPTGHTWLAEVSFKTY